MLEIYKKAFKAYDIRGISGEQINEKFMYVLGKGTGDYLIQNYGQGVKLLIGCDVREGNAVYLPHFLKGLNEMGIQNVAFAKFGDQDESKYPFGICSTGVIYYLGQGDFDLGIAVTASHNPKEYLGMKFFDGQVNMLYTDVLRELFEKYYFEGEYDDVAQTNFDTSYQKDLIWKKKNNLFNFLEGKRNNIKKHHKIVVDFSTGAGITVEKEFFEKMKGKHDFIYINDYADGTFSAHESDTSDTKNYKQLIEKVKNENADFGIMFDGDVDRIGFVSSDGEVVNGDLITAIIANQVLKNRKGDIIFDIMSSKIIGDIAQKYGVNGIRYKTGRLFISKKLAEIHGALGGEVSGHYMFSEIGGYEMPLLAMYYVLLELEGNNNFSDMLNLYKKYYKTPILSHKTDRKNEILEEIKKEFGQYHQEYLDGVSVFGDDFWFNVRGSNSENKVRFAVEANLPEKMNEIREKIEKIIN